MFFSLRTSMEVEMLRTNLTFQDKCRNFEMKPNSVLLYYCLKKMPCVAEFVKLCFGMGFSNKYII